MNIVQYSLSEAQKTMDQHGCDRGKVLFATSHPPPTTTITTATAITTSSSSGGDNANDDDIFFKDIAGSVPMIVDLDKGADGEASVPGNINGDGDTTDLSSASSSTDIATTATTTAVVVSAVSDDATMGTPPLPSSPSPPTFPNDLYSSNNAFDNTPPISIPTPSPLNDSILFIHSRPLLSPPL